MDLDELKRAAADGSVDTVLLAIADMEGSLQGKRMTASHFIDDVLEHGAEGCNYLLAVDVDMETVDGYEMSSWERGYGDFEMVPDLDTLRPIPWHPATVLVMADLQWTPTTRWWHPRARSCSRQLTAWPSAAWTAMAGTELEFMLFKDTYEEAWRADTATGRRPTSTTWTTHCWAPRAWSR